ncbi:MAG TPA: apolipoprotein N-acyltransferase [Firmicutes bacterium]|nr:apolipoprotein N-acyltransferase [Bacillota bacterium]
MQRSRIGYWALPLFSSFLLILSFPPWNQGYLAWISFLPLFYFLYRHLDSSTRISIFLGGFITGMFFFLYLYSYMAVAVNFLFPPYLGYLVVFAASLYSAIFFGLFSLFFSFSLKGKNITLSIMAAPAAWVLLEYFRSLGLLGHTGGFLGYSQSNYTPILQAASLYGYWGLPFLIIFLQTIIFFRFTALKAKKGSPLRKLLLPLIIFLTMLGSGIILPSFFPAEEKSDIFRIALIQGNIPQKDILNPSSAKDNFQKYLELTGKAYRLFAPLDLIVWPETVFSTSVAHYYPEAEKEIMLLAEETGAPILLGAMYTDHEEGNTYNSILLQKSSRESQGKQRYDKIRLVPFAEYFPFPGLLNKIWPAKISLGTYTPGTDIRLFNLGNWDIGGIICFESYFSDPALKTAQKGAEHLFVLSNDAWFFESSGMEQHAQAAAIRAVETGLGVTQVANTGYTISFDYKGRKILSLPRTEDGIALLETNLPQRTTLYRCWGDYFLFLCCIILFVFTLNRYLSQ